MEIQGAKGFAAIKYDPVMLGQYILENLLGVQEMQKLSKMDKANYVKEHYPLVMAFFKVNDLQPTLMNLRMNLEAIKKYSLAADKQGQAEEKIEAAQAELAAEAVSFLGVEPETTRWNSEQTMSAVFLVGILLLIIFLIK